MIDFVHEVNMLFLKKGRLSGAPFFMESSEKIKRTNFSLRQLFEL